MNFTKADAEAMQDRVNRLKIKTIVVKSAVPDGFQKFVVVDNSKRTKTPPTPLSPTETVERQGKAKKSKYGNIRVKIDGIWFDSTLEGRRYTELKLLKAVGEVLDFEMQVTYRLEVNGIHICNYRADFVVKYQTGPYSYRIEVEDTKGVETAKFILQKKLMLAVHGIKIKLIRAKK